MENGFPKKMLDKVYSPIGIEINAEIPAEIALSIMGQIVQVRAQK